MRYIENYNLDAIAHLEGITRSGASRKWHRILKELAVLTEKKNFLKIPLPENGLAIGAL